MNVQVPLNYNAHSYNLAVSKIENSKNKSVVFDENLNVQYAGFFRRLLGKVKALFGQSDQTQREVVVYRAIQFLELGAHEGWLDKTKILRVASQFFTNHDGTRNDEVLDLATKIFEKKSWKELPATEQTEFSQRYLQHHQKKLKHTPKQPLFTFIPNPEAAPIPSPVLKENFQDGVKAENNPNDEPFAPIAIPPPYFAPKDPKVPLITPIASIQKAEEKVVLPIPIFILPDSLKGVSDALHKAYPKALFVSNIEEFQKEMGQLKHQSVVAVCIERHDVALNDFGHIKENLEKLKSFPNVEPVYISASRKGTDANQKGIKNLKTFLENSSLSKHQYMAIDFEYLGPKQILSQETCKELLQSLNGILEKNQKVVEEPLTPQIQLPSPTLQKNRITSLHPLLKPVDAVAPVEAVKVARMANPVPVFVCNIEMPLMIESLKKVYPDAIFTTSKTFKNDIEKLNNQPISTYYIHREDTRLSYPEELEKMLTNFTEPSLLGKFGFIIIYAKESSIKLDTRPLTNHFKQSANAKIKQVNCLLLPYSSKNSYKGNERNVDKFFEKEEEKELLDFINNILKKD